MARERHWVVDSLKRGPLRVRCPHCQRGITIGDDDRQLDRLFFLVPHRKGHSGLHIEAWVCPDPQCQELVMTVSLCRATVFTNDGLAGPAGTLHETVQRWRLLPSSQEKRQPNWIPEPIRQRYYEACRTLDASPNASAVMSRACLEGMLVERWHGKGRGLSALLNSVRDTLDAETWGAIDGVREIGNSGAHPPWAGRNLPDTVTPEEARDLIEVVEYLLKTWQQEKDATEQLQKVKAAGERRRAQRQQ